ncbi:hypothetical protein [uncultured Treponema sp.]|uniref:hypothetical protein n=1 Tax=uncultured Treponema sp. TaxID=162155 RepID=UPI0025CFA049|nr:hypothetical protein [uncultured Treponema sp.]
MTKTLFRGNKKIAKDAGYALFVGMGVLCIVSFFFMTLVALSRMKLENLEIQSTVFYSSMKERNERVLAEWKNYPETDEELKTFETD